MTLPAVSIPPARVAAIIATMHRPAEVAALLQSLAAIPAGLHAVVVVDNGSEPETARVVETSPVPALYVDARRNRGCGGGLRLGEETALERFGPELTHLWILDDDCLVQPDTLQQQLDAMTATGAVVSYPLVETREGRLSWFPGLLDRAQLRFAANQPLPDEFIARFGPGPQPFSWALGIGLLVARAGWERAGLHRDDFWVRGEDLDFSLRLTASGYVGDFVPQARIRHLPPASTSEPAFAYRRDAALLQNVAYIGLRLPHGRRIARTLPGNWWRFLKNWGRSPRVLLEIARTFWWGAVRGWPAGRTYGAEQGREGNGH